MNADELRSLQTPLKERYRSNPESAKVTLRVHGELDLPRLACHISTGRETVTHAGMHAMAGGDGSMACAAEMLLEALVGCVGVTLCAVATAMSLPITRGTISAEGDLDFRGTLGIDRQTPVGFQAIRLVFELATTADDAQLQKLQELAERYCVVAQTLNAAAKPQIVCRRLSSE